MIATDKRESWQTEVQYFEPAFSGHVRIPLDHISTLPLTAEKIIDILAQMDFKPLVSPTLHPMPPTLFEATWGGLKGLMQA